MKSQWRMASDALLSSANDYLSGPGRAKGERINRLISDLRAEGLDVRLSNYNLETLLGQACRRGAYEAALALIEAGVDVNAADQHGCTPFYRFAQASDNRKYGEARDEDNLFAWARVLCKTLILAGADIETPSKAGRTPLLAACGSGSPNLPCLIEAGCRVDVATPEGVQPLGLLLVWAGRSHFHYPDFETLATQLVQAGAQLNEVSSQIVMESIGKVPGAANQISRVRAMVSRHRLQQAHSRPNVDTALQSVAHEEC